MNKIKFFLPRIRVNKLIKQNKKINPLIKLNFYFLE